MNIHFEECRERSCFHADHTVTIGGQIIPYHTICEDNYFYDDETGKPVASIFSYSYLRTDVADASRRPVIFAYNGGPGSSSVWLQMGFMGPQRVHMGDAKQIPTTTPFTLEDNPNCPLDVCDIVLVDMVGAGMGRLFDENAKDIFFSADKEIRQIALFIDHWLTRNHRRNSPLFLFGESYSTGRTALLTAELLGGSRDNRTTLGIPVNGVILLGSYFFEKLMFPGTALCLPSMAAANWYYHPDGKPELKEFISETYDFIEKKYLPAYHKGDFLPQAELADIVNKMSYFTGLSAAYLDTCWMCLTLDDFRRQFLLNSHELLALYDARYIWKDIPHLPASNVIADDPAMGRYIPAYMTGFAMLRKELGIELDRANYGVDLSVGVRWNGHLEYQPADALAASMRRNERLKVMFASGLYDLCTPFGNARYIASHSKLDVSRVQMCEYPSGHMLYLDDENAARLGKDLRQFIGSSI